MTMMLDSDVLIDCLRGTANAKAWLSVQGEQTFVVPSIAAMELIAGCRNQIELERTKRFLDTFSIAWTEAKEFERAFELMVATRLSSGLSIPDYLIAAMALERSMTLQTFNLKDYRFIEGLIVQEPYSR